MPTVASESYQVVSLPADHQFVSGLSLYYAKVQRFFASDELTVPFISVQPCHPFNLLGSQEPDQERINLCWSGKSKIDLNLFKVP